MLHQAYTIINGEVETQDSTFKLSDTISQLREFFNLTKKQRNVRVKAQEYELVRQDNGGKDEQIKLIGDF